MREFSVKNYKCLADVTVPLTPIHVIVGQNDAGKTSLLEAMQAFFRSSMMPLAQSFSGKWEGTDLVFEGAAKPVIEFAGRFHQSAAAGQPPAEFQYGFDMEFAPRTQPKLLREWFIDATDGKRQDLKYGDHQTSVCERSQMPENRRVPAQSLIADCLGPAHLYRFDPKLMALPAAHEPKRKFRMDPDGFGLATMLDDILGYDLELFKSLRQRFCEFFPQFRSVRLETENAARREYNESGISTIRSDVGKEIYFETRRGRSIHAQQASDGAILFLGFLALIHLPEPPKLLLIEEPEKGVYPKRLDEIVRLLREAVEGDPGSLRPQVVLSTHSPYLLSSFAPEQVTVMSRQTDGSVRARPLRDAPHVKERMAEEFYLGELWYNLTEEELFGDAQLQGA